MITSLTFKAFPSPQTTSWDVQATLTNGNEDSFWDFIAEFHGMLADLKRSGLQGYYYIFGPPIMPFLYLGLRFMAFDEPDGAVEMATKPFREKLDELKGTIKWDDRIERFETFDKAYKGDVANEPVGTGGIALGSRLLPEEALKDKKRFKEVLRAVGPILDQKRVSSLCIPRSKT